MEVRWKMKKKCVPLINHFFTYLRAEVAKKRKRNSKILAFRRKRSKQFEENVFTKAQICLPEDDLPPVIYQGDALRWKIKKKGVPLFNHFFTYLRFYRAEVAKKRKRNSEILAFRRKRSNQFEENVFQTDFFTKAQFCLPEDCLPPVIYQGDARCCYAFVVMNLIYIDLSINQGVGSQGSVQELLDCLDLYYPLEKEEDSPLEATDEEEEDSLLEATDEEEEDSPLEATDEEEDSPLGATDEEDDSPDYGQGNHFLNAFAYIHRFGVSLAKDYPYEGECKGCLKDVVPRDQIIRVGTFYCINDHAIAASYMKEGRALTGAVMATNDLANWFEKRVYTAEDERKAMKKKSGYHAITLIGFGEENGIQYYIAQNTSGENWGFHGYFKIERAIVSDIYYLKDCRVVSLR